MSERYEELLDWLDKQLRKCDINIEHAQKRGDASGLDGLTRKKKVYNDLRQCVEQAMHC